MSPADHSLVVRPIRADERARFDETLAAEHSLGAGLVGETMRYVATTESDEWCALVGFGSAALCVRVREELVSWNQSQRHLRLRYLTNNQRFLVREPRRRPNLASEVLSRCLRRISSDFERRWGHPVIAVETFTDPSRHLGTCYRASNFTLVGYTSGYRRSAGHFVHHGETKAYWLRALRPDATELLALSFDHPAITKRSTAQMTDVNPLDLSSLLEAFNEVPDPKKRRGIRHRLAQVLAIATLATLRGGVSLVSIGEVAKELPAEALERLGCFSSPSRGELVAPEESTIRRVLHLIDGDALDRVVSSWMHAQVSAGWLREEEIPEVSFQAMVDEDASESDQDRTDRPGEGSDDQATQTDLPGQVSEDDKGDDDKGEDDRGDDDKGEDDEKAPRALSSIAIDGKTLRGAFLEEGRQLHLMSAFDGTSGSTIAQSNVDVKTNEITVAAPMLEPLDIRGLVVTADALHTQRALAAFLVEEKQAHYLLTEQQML